jgi:NAD(P)-dependent dehydrogenase (short-subunit alcohol dehydrogenase family)
MSGGVAGGGRLAGKRAVVTGGASGLGLAIARAFVAEGGRVALADIAEEAGRRAAMELGSATLFLAHDVADEASWARVLDAAAAGLGGIDTLVNNAGIAPSGNVEKTSLAEWRRVHAVNLDGVFLGCRGALPHLRAAGGGAIVNMSSVAGMIGTPTLAAYGSSKAAVRQLTKSVALHCAHRKDAIRCNSIHPVFAATPMVEAMVAGARDPVAARAALAAQVPLGRLAQAEEVAAMAVYLASEEARFVTGAEFVIDGGLTAG